MKRYNEELSMRCSRVVRSNSSLCTMAAWRGSGDRGITVGELSKEVAVPSVHFVGLRGGGMALVHS